MSQGELELALVIPKYGLMGGAESVAFEMGERLVQTGSISIHVLANRWKPGNPDIRFHKIPIFKFPRLLQPISFAHFVDRWVRNHPHILVHSHERINCMDFLTYHGIPHQTWITEVRKKKMGLFDRATARVERKGIGKARLSCIMPVSSLVRDELMKCYDIPESKVKIIHPGISIHRFIGQNREGYRQEVRARHNLLASDLVLLFVGMNFEIKRLDLVMKGMAHAVKMNPEIPWKLVVAGKGDSRRYESLSRQLGIHNRVVMAGPVPSVDSYYFASDIFVMPSWMDTFGMAALEAMAAGLPVVLSAKVGARDLVESGEQGFILSGAPEAEELGNVLDRLSDPLLRKAMGEKAAQKAATRSWEKVVQDLLPIYFNKKESFQG